MNPFLMAYANSYDNGQKLYEDLPTTYQGTPEPDNSGFAYGGQSIGQTVANVTPRTPYQPAYTTSGLFGSGAATQGRTPDQLATIRGTWNQFTSGALPASAVKQAMEQYGVNFADIAAATGLPIDSLVSSLNQGLSSAQQRPQTPAPKPTFGSPYNPDIVAPNPDGSGRPLGTMHPVSGMTGGNTSGSYADRMNQYYNAYFKDAPGIDQGMLSDWYSTSYNPAPTGFSTSNKGASSAQGLLNSLQWGTPAVDAQSTPRLFNYMSMYGLKPADVANALGMTEQQIIDHFKKYNMDVTRLGGVSSSITPKTDPLLDRPNDGG